MNLYTKKIEFDINGYLKNINCWNEKLAIQIAKTENIIITKEHWKIIYFMRNFYLKFNILPTVRMLAKYMAEEHGKKIGNSCYLFVLFPKGPMQQATKIAGLPKSTICI
ncbi:MAG: TusE/DsrC/DsvC family sulfur relay protein [Pantoea sp. Brub]|nr:TusE/DsrC/DsvC family sulfur relay protein [Pantoea sp. Brub]